MELVNVWHAQSWKHDKQDHVSENEIGGEETKLGDLAKELSSWLRECVPSERIPFSSPPCYVRLVTLEFSGKRKGDDQLVDESLESHHSDHSQKCFGEYPSFEEEHDLPEGK